MRMRRVLGVLGLQCAAFPRSHREIALLLLWLFPPFLSLQVPPAARSMWPSKPLGCWQSAPVPCSQTNSSFPSFLGPSVVHMFRTRPSLESSGFKMRKAKSGPKLQGSKCRGGSLLRSGVDCPKNLIRSEQTFPSCNTPSNWVISIDRWNA